MNASKLASLIDNLDTYLYLVAIATGIQALPDRLVRDKRIFRLHEIIRRSVPSWTPRDTAELLGLRTAEMALILGGVKGTQYKGIDTCTYIVITANDHPGYVLGELLIVDQGLLEVCGRQRSPQRDHVPYERYDDFSFALHRAKTISLRGSPS